MNDDKPTAKGEPRQGRPDDEPDAVTERVGTHSLGAVGGTLAGAAAGAVSGLAAGPIGSLAGAIGGAVLGGAAGVSTGGPAVDTSTIDAYWRDHYTTRPYVPPGARYEDYEPAYRHAVQSYLRTDHPRAWHEVEHELAGRWSSAKGSSRLGWSEAREAVREAWERLYEGTDTLVRNDSSSPAKDKP